MKTRVDARASVSSSLARATVAMHGGSLEARLAAMDGAESAIVLGSGMAAIACTMLSLLRSGDHVVVSSWVHGDVRRFFEQELPSLGIEVTFVDPTETRGWRRVTRGNTRLFFLESPVRETTRVIDLSPPRLLAQELGIALVVDSTAACAVNFRPVEQGVDVVVQSATMLLHDEHGMQGGVVCGAEAVIDEVREKMSLWGHAPDALLYAQLERGVRTLDIRVRRQCQNAELVARWAESHAHIGHVYYPGLRSHPDHEVAATTFEGFGNQIVLELTGGSRAATSLISRAQLFRHSATVGGVTSRIHDVGARANAAANEQIIDGLPLHEGAVRLSIGIEAAGDLIADLEQALE